jgi:hypothetical protein
MVLCFRLRLRAHPSLRPKGEMGYRLTASKIVEEMNRPLRRNTNEELTFLTDGETRKLTDRTPRIFLPLPPANLPRTFSVESIIRIYTRANHRQLAGYDELDSVGTISTRNSFLSRSLEHSCRMAI